MKEKISIGYIGLGGRGMGLLKLLLSQMKDLDILGVCDIYEDRMNDGAALVKKHRGNTPIVTKDYKELIANKDIDTIFIATSWEDHLKIAHESMEAGKFTAMEVGGAYSLQDCWDLVDCYERTKTPVMLLENCCYGEYELMVLNMVKKGLFGKIVHCEGGYMHDLRYEISHGKENRHYRLNNYINRNCENYPTHELGPIAKVLNINHGNRITSLYSASSKAEGLKEYIKTKKNDDKDLMATEFKQGDIVTTTLICENGETIVLTLDTTLPRTYSRHFTVRGTKGMYSEDTNNIFIDGKHNIFDFKPRLIWNNARKYRRKYNHPIWKNVSGKVLRAGHGGMDYFVLRAMIESAKNGTYPPIDVYDTATWMAVTCLSETSINNKAVVDFPDFTRGKYKNRTEANGTMYDLDN